MTETYILINNSETKQLRSIEISNFGNIRKTFKRGLVRINQGNNDKDGYKILSIKKKKLRVHRVVLEHFIGECPTGFECDHIDRNRSNNHINNLRWVSKSDNHYNKQKKGSIMKVVRKKDDRWRFRYILGGRNTSKTFKTERNAKLAQAIYIAFSSYL